MVEFITLPLSKIHVSKDRSREVDEDHALVIGSSIIEIGQLQPILVRKTPNGKAPYTLVIGGHRYRGIEICGASQTIDALVTKADSTDAAIMEVAENVFRHELTILDRAMAVQIYRDAWEKKNGKINSKGGHNNLPNMDNLSTLVERQCGEGFSEACAERLGLSPKAIQRANRISQNIPTVLLKKLRGTAAANNQSQLLKFAGLPPQQLANAVRAIDLAKGNPTMALAALSDKKPDARSAQAKLRDTCMSAFGKLTVKNQKTLLAALQKNHEQDAKRAADKKRNA